MRQQKTLSIASIIILILGIFSPVAFSVLVTGQGSSQGVVLSAFAKDGEDDDHSGSGKDDDDDEDEDEDHSGSGKNEDDEDEEDNESETVKQAKEIAKEQAKRQKEALKTRTESVRETAKKQEETDKERADLQYQSAKIIENVYEELIKAEQRINEAKAEGVDVSLALRSLNQAKQKAQELESQLGTLNIDAAKRLAKEVRKIAHFASHKDVHVARDLAKDIAKVDKRITQTEGKIFLLGQLGGETGGYTDTLNGYKASFEALKARIAAGGDDGLNAVTELEPLERQVKVLKSVVEKEIYALGGTDELFDDNYEEEMDDFSQNISDVAEIEGDKTGALLMGIAAEQKASATTVGSALTSIDERNQLFQLLFGVKEIDLITLKQQVESNALRAQTLETIAETIDDEELKQILLDEAARLEQENEKLSVFIEAQQKRSSAFGWVKRIFS